MSDPWAWTETFSRTDRPSRERCVYCGLTDYEPGWGCHSCGTATLEDVAGQRGFTSTEGD